MTGNTMKTRMQVGGLILSCCCLLGCPNGKADHGHSHDTPAEPQANDGGGAKAKAEPAAEPQTNADGDAKVKAEADHGHSHEPPAEPQTDDGSDAKAKAEADHGHSHGE